MHMVCVAFAGLGFDTRKSEPCGPSEKALKQTLRVCLRARFKINRLKTNCSKLFPKKTGIFRRIQEFAPKARKKPFFRTQGGKSLAQRFAYWVGNTSWKYILL